MHEDNDRFDIVQSNENFQTWSMKEFLTDDIRESIANASILLVPTEGFKDFSAPSFPPLTEDIFLFIKKNIPVEYSVDICISDMNFSVLSLNSDYKRLGKFVVKEMAVPLFIGLLTAYISYKIITEEDSKPQINIVNNVTNNITNITPPEKQVVKKVPASEPHSPHKYLEPSKVTFSITVVDTNGKSIDFHYSGSPKDVDKITEKVKNAFVDGH